MYEDIIKKAFLRILPSDTLFASEVAICLRRSILARRQQTVKAIDNMLIEYGVIMHDVIEEYVTHQLNCQSEVELRDEIEGVKISGRIDLLCQRDNGYDLLELKTTGYDAWEVKYYHKAQVALYKLMLERRGIKIENVYVIYINRQTLNVKEFRLRERDIEEGLNLAIKFIQNYIKNKDIKDVRKLEIADKIFCKGCEFYNYCYQGNTIFDFTKSADTKA